MGTLIFKELYLDGSDKPTKCLCSSYSQIDTWESCNFKWFLSYLLGKRSNGKAEALDLGSSIHITLEEYYNAIKEGKEWTLGEAIDILEFNMDKQEIEFASDDNKELAIQQHKEMISKLISGDSKLAKLLKNCQIVACEKEFQYRIDLPFKVKYGDEIYESIYIIGSIDLIVKDENGGLIIIDYKSGKKVFEPKKLKTNLQLPIYSIITNHIYKRMPVRTLYYFTRLDEIQEVQVPALTKESANIEYYKNGNVKSVQRTVDEIMNELLSIYESMYTVGEYKPTNTPLCCWCDYHQRYGDGTCKYGNETYWRKDIKAKGY